MPRRPRILFLANWPATHRRGDDYAFFAHWEHPPRIRFFGTFDLGWWTRWERERLKFYLLQPLLALFLAPFYDAVIAFSSQSGLPFAALLRICFWMRTKLIDVETFGRPTGGPRLALARFAARRINFVIYAAKGQEAHYDRHFPFLVLRRAYIPIGIGEYHKRLPDDAGRDGPVVALGRHGAAFRDWRTLLAAAADCPAVELRIVGRDGLPPEERGGVPIPPNVRFVPYLPMGELQGAIERARFVVLPLPNREQSLGQLSILLAMAMGKAVVASRVVGVADYLREGETGLFYPAGDARELADRLNLLWNDPERAIAMGRVARALQQAEFGDRLMAKRWEEVYRRVMADRETATSRGGPSARASDD
jgi:glycosyltransferase involved in cell wall biosynthesis